MDDSTLAWDAHVTEDAGGLVLHVGGELDIATEPRLRALLADLRRERGPLLVDARRLRFVDVHGMRLLAHERVRRVRDGGDLTVVSPSPGVRRALVTAGLAALLAGNAEPALSA